MTLVYSGVAVSPLFDSFWRTGLQVGESKPVVTVSVRRGQFERSFHPWTGPTIGEIAGDPVHENPWYPEWTPLDAYTEIVGVKEVRIQQSNDQNGVATASIDCDNSQWQQQAGPGGIYHVLDKGYLSPLRGYQYPGRPSPGVAENETWYKRLPNAQVLVTAGYGAQVYPVFTGLIDDLDISSKDVKLTITARDFGGVLVDEFFYGWVVDRNASFDPTIFFPRWQAYKTTRVGGGAAATSSLPGYPPRGVTVPNSRKPWRSRAHSSPNANVSLEVRLPQGRYNTFYINPILNGHTIYMGVYVRPRGNYEDGYQHGSWFPQFGGSVRHDIDESLLDVQGYKTDRFGNSVPEGWLKTGDAVHVPADSDGTDGPWWAYRHFDRIRNGGQQLPFGGDLIVGADSVMRIGFTNLQRDSLDGHLRAGCIRLYANQEHVTQQAVNQSAILVTDVAEVVMWCLRQAGFKEWEVDYTGVNMKMPLQVDKAKSLVDIINMVKDQVGYTFFIAEPTSNDLSIGVPVFRLNSVMRDRPDQTVREVRDSDLLTDQKIKISNQSERTIIRTYGGMNTPNKLLPKNESANGNRVQQPSGAVTFRHQTRTLPPSAAYVPPWKAGMAGVIKHMNHYDATYVTAVDCEFAALLIALQIALAKYTSTIAIPWTPAIGLDSFVSIVDTPSGTDSRLYTTNRSATLTTGEDAKAILELGGSLIDNPDIQQVREDWKWAVATMDRNDW